MRASTQHAKITWCFLNTTHETDEISLLCISILGTGAVVLSGTDLKNRCLLWCLRTSVLLPRRAVLSTGCSRADQKRCYRCCNVLYMSLTAVHSSKYALCFQNGLVYIRSVLLWTEAVEVLAKQLLVPQQISWFPSLPELPRVGMRFA